MKHGLARVVWFGLLFWLLVFGLMFASEAGSVLWFSFAAGPVGFVYNSAEVAVVWFANGCICWVFDVFVVFCHCILGREERGPPIVACG